MKKKGNKKKTKKSSQPASSKNQRRRSPKEFTEPAIPETNKEDYDEKVLEMIRPWKVLASENRKRGMKNMNELLQDSSPDKDYDKKRIALEAIKSTVIEFGTVISRIILEYLLVYYHYDPKVFYSKTRFIANTIRLESLGNESVIVDNFVATIEAIERKIKYPIHYNDREFFDDDSNEEEVHEVWMEDIDIRILGDIFYRVLFLEIVFCFPGFSGDEEYDNLEWVSTLIEIQILRWGSLTALRSDLADLKKEVDEFERLFPVKIHSDDHIIGADDAGLKSVFGLMIKEIWKQL